MAKGIIDRNLSINLHQNILPLIMVTSFIIHVSISTKYSFMRWRIWNMATKIATIVIFTLFYLFFIYFQYFYQPAIPKIINMSPSVSPNQKNSQQVQKIFTVSELAKYDGKNGNAAYAAVDGTVYDLTNVFINGEHFGHTAGQDLTNVFYTKHVKSLIEKYPVVGILK
jgi:predicted heme/steroid binding protein